MEKGKQPFIYTNGKKWFFHLKGESGLLEYLSDDDKVSQLIVSFINPEGRRYYTSFDTHIDFLQHMLLLPIEKRCFHEVVIEKRIQKMRFDIDIKKYKYFENQIIEEITETDVQDFLNQLIDSTIEEYKNMGLTVDPKQNILVYSSHGKEKWSFHIIIDGFYCDTHQDASELFKKIISHMSKKYLDWLDSSIYSVNHCLRALGCVKEGQNEIRVKKLEKSWKYKDTEIVFEYPETPIHEKHQMAMEFERSFLTLVSNCYPIPSLVSKQALDGVSKFSEKQVGNEILNYAFLVFQSRYGNVCSYFSSMGNMIMLTRNYASGCPICERVHEHENAFLIVKEIESEVHTLQKYEIYLYCRRASGKKIKIGEKVVVDQTVIPKEKVVSEKVSKIGFRLEDLNYVSKTSTRSFK